VWESSLAVYYRRAKVHGALVGVRVLSWRCPLYAMSCYTVADTAITFVDYVMFGPFLMSNAICYNYVVCLSVCLCRSVIITVALLWWFSPWFDTEDVDPDSENDFVGGLILPNFFFYFIPKMRHFWLRGIEIHKFLKVFRVGQFSIFRELFVEEHLIGAILKLVNFVVFNLIFI